MHARSLALLRAPRVAAAFVGRRVAARHLEARGLKALLEDLEDEVSPRHDRDLPSTYHIHCSLRYVATSIA